MFFKRNVIEVDWVLSGKTGLLMWASYRLVRREPRQRILLSCSKGDRDIRAQYQRILDDRKERGIANG